MTISLIGRSTRLDVDISAEDVSTFGRVTRDDHPIHVDEAFARQAGLPGCIVQGSFLVGLMAGASTQFFRDLDRPALSYGYDRVRFTGQFPVSGHAVVDYVVVEEDTATGKLWADVTVRSREGQLLAVARHIAKLL
jgi:3-hydroxybutyryl-CoA dehydratase